MRPIRQTPPRKIALGPIPLWVGRLLIGYSVYGLRLMVSLDYLEARGPPLSRHLKRTASCIGGTRLHFVKLLGVVAGSRRYRVGASWLSVLVCLCVFVCKRSSLAGE